MHSNLRLLFGFTLSCVLLSADGIMTAVSCDVEFSPDVTSTSSCFNQFQVGENPIDRSSASATSSAAFTYPNNPSGNIVATVSTSANADGLELESLGSASAHVSFGLDTDGPLRAGYLQVAFPDIASIGAGEEFDSAVSLTIGSFDVTCRLGYPGDIPCIALVGGIPVPISGGPGGPLVGPGSRVKLPFLLGQPFSFDLSASADALSGGGTETSEAFGHETVEFRFLEADGVTPVGLAPEPATWALFTLAAMLVAFTRRRRRESVSG